eukprot:592625-Lingulodinium_polyedra.AAC.1
MRSRVEGLCNAQATQTTQCVKSTLCVRYRVVRGPGSAVQAARRILGAYHKYVTRPLSGRIA